MYRYIAIEGNIGSGKTSLAHMVSADLQARLILEEFADNAFLPKFYEHPERYAFPLELSFLSERYSQLKREMNTRDLFSPVIVSDYFISKCQIFAKNNLNKDEYELFLKMFEIVQGACPKPDLLVYLYLSVDQLQANIRKRGREYEQKITDDYLDNIQKQYLEFIRQHEDMRILIIDTSGLDFVKNREDYLYLSNLINKPYQRGIHRIEARSMTV
ncbi:MAG: deoxynucleoside kinase [Flavobacteriales bacterium]|nr:deoxynucleoside kinase [Flavobacteriales bacterium]